MSNASTNELLLHASDIAHESEDWLQPLLPTLRTIDAPGAAWKPTARSKSVWEIVAHLTQYVETLAADLNGEKGPEIDDWPDIADTSATAWSALVERLETGAGRLKSTLEGAAEIELRNQRRIVNILMHDAYHAGQIYQLVALREAMAPELAGASQ